jgi:mediator of RNA polymerase II transcription subunit 10
MAPTIPSHPPPTTAPLTRSIQTLYNLLVCATDHRGAQTESAMLAETSNLHAHLLALSRAARTLAIELPPEIVQYVEDGRNPDIYTREFAELAQRNNQKLKGKSEAFARFAQVLGREIGGGVPELRAVAEGVLERTGVGKGEKGEKWEDEEVGKKEADEMVGVKREGEEGG